MSEADTARKDQEEFLRPVTTGVYLTNGMSATARLFLQFLLIMQRICNNYSDSIIIMQVFVTALVLTASDRHRR